MTRGLHQQIHRFGKNYNNSDKRIAELLEEHAEFEDTIALIQQIVNDPKKARALDGLERFQLLANRVIKKATTNLEGLGSSIDRVQGPKLGRKLSRRMRVATMLTYEGDVVQRYLDAIHTTKTGLQLILNSASW